MVPTAVSGSSFVAAVACMCSSAAGTFGAAAVLVLPDIHCLIAVGAATAAVVALAATVAASASGAANFSVSVVAGDVAAGFSTWVLSAAVLSTPLVCTVQTFPSPYVLSLSTLVQPLLHLATFYAAYACMHLRTCGRHNS